MANNEITIPVSIKRKDDVTKREQHSKISVLFINNRGHAHMVPLDMSKKLVKDKQGYVMEKSHKDYMKYYKMAIGFDEKIGTEKFCQVAGKVTSIDDATKTDIHALVQKESVECSKAQKEAKE